MNFKYVLIFKPLRMTMFWAPPIGIYVSTKTSFILGLVTDLCVVLGLVTKIMWS